MKIEPTDNDTIIRIEQRAFEQFMRFRTALINAFEGDALSRDDGEALGLTEEDIADLHY